MENERLIDVINSLTGSCFTREHAKNLINDLVQERKPQTPVTFDEQTVGVKELIKRRFIKSEDGLSFIKRLYEDQIKLEGFTEKARGINLPDGKKKPNAKHGSGYTHTFKKGQLRDAIIRAINKGATSVPGIIAEVASKYGHSEKDIYGNIHSGVSGMTKDGFLTRVRGADNEWRYSVVVYDSMEQKEGI